MIGTLGPPHAHGLEPGREEIRLAAARRNGWPQLERADLAFHRFGIVEHRPTGGLYAIHRGELVDAVYTSASAYYLNERNEVVFLQEPPPGTPRTVAELEQRQAEHRKRRNAGTPRRQATRQ